MSKKVVIVGGVAGGASAAARLRRLDENMEIVIFERGEHISYANCGLPYYISGVIKEREALLVQTPEGMKARFNIDVRTLSEVTRIFPEEKEIEVQDAKGSTYRESYDTLILSPGAAPVRPPIPGIDDIDYFTIRNVNDIDRVKEYIQNAKPESAVVVGGGFIGLEMAENIAHLGVDTTIVEASDQVMAPLDYEMAAILHEHIFNKGVDLILEDGVASFENTDKGTKLILQSGDEVEAELVVLAIGVKPETKLAKEAGLEIGELGGIKVNEKLQTSDPNIYAVGDVIEVTNFVTGKPALIPLAGPANRQGRMVADIICGRDRKYEGTLGTSIAKVFDLAAASTGANEKTLKKLGIPHLVSYTHSFSHASYYPGGTRVSIKLIFSPDDGKVLGAQVVGANGVDKRIDDIAAVIRMRGTIYDLQDLELAYAPPFSSAKDPVNMAGYVAENILKGDVKMVQWQEVMEMDPNEVYILDVRDLEERKAKFIPGSVHCPVNNLRDFMPQIPKDKEVVVYCEIGLRGYLAYRMLKQHGFENVRNLAGGWVTYYPPVFG